MLVVVGYDLVMRRIILDLRTSWMREVGAEKGAVADDWQVHPVRRGVVSW